MEELEQRLKTHDVVELIDSLFQRINVAGKQMELHNQLLMTTGC